MTTTPRMIDPFLAELEQEAAATRRLLGSVPSDKLDWRPHEKSMSLGELAFHIAGLPGGISALLEQDSWDVATTSFKPPQPKSTEEIVKRFDSALDEAKTRMNNLTDAAARSNWSMVKGAQEMFTIPKIGVVRTMMFNHLYHHRGQLSVYLRLLDVPVPPTYGPSADVNPLL